MNPLDSQQFLDEANKSGMIMLKLLPMSHTQLGKVRFDQLLPEIDRFKRLVVMLAANQRQEEGGA